MATELGDPGLEGDAGAGRRGGEEHPEAFSSQDVTVILADCDATLEVEGHIEYRFQLLLAVVHDADEILALHVSDHVYSFPPFPYSPSVLQT